MVDTRRVDREVLVAAAEATVFLLGTGTSAVSALTPTLEPRVFLLVEAAGAAEAREDGLRVRVLGGSSGSSSEPSVSREERDFFVGGRFSACPSSSSCTSSSDFLERVDVRGFVGWTEVDLRVLAAGFTSSGSSSTISSGSLRLRFVAGAVGSTDARVLDERRGGIVVSWGASRENQ